MRANILSLIFASASLLLSFWFNLNNLYLFHAMSKRMYVDTGLSPFVISTSKTLKIFALSLGLIGLVLGIVSRPRKCKWKIIGIVVSVIAILLAVVPLWILFPK